VLVSLAKQCTTVTDICDVQPVVHDQCDNCSRAAFDGLVHSSDVLHNVGVVLLSDGGREAVWNLQRKLDVLNYCQ